jgi:8-oxoguanine deaminase
VIENCAIATMDGPRHDQGGSEYRSGHVTVTGDRITAVGDGPAGSVPDGTRRIDAGGCLATPGLVNTHHHLYQWLTQGRAQQSVLFDWLTELYPVWATIDAGQVHAAATAGLAWLALSGCTTSTDHHYIFTREAPRGDGDADALAAEVAAAARVGLRFHPCRGSMDLGRSAGGLPPDEIVEDTDAALAATEEAVRRFHDPSPGAMVRVAAAPCSPFSVSPRLMRETADLARALGVRMHTHLAETREEDAYCRQALGRTLPSTRRTWAGSARTSGWPTAFTSTKPRSGGSPPPARRWRTAPPRTRDSARASRRSGTCSRPESRSDWAWTVPPRARAVRWPASCARPCSPRGSGTGTGRPR